MSGQYDNFTVRIENGKVEELDRTITGMKASGKLSDNTKRSEVVREVIEDWLEENKEYREILENLENGA